MPVTRMYVASTTALVTGVCSRFSSISVAWLRITQNRILLAIVFLGENRRLDHDLDTIEPQVDRSKLHELLA